MSVNPLFLTRSFQPAALVERITEDAKERAQTALAAVIAAAEAPGVLATLRKSLKEAQGETPALETRQQQAAKALAHEQTTISELEGKIRTLPSLGYPQITPDQRKELVTATGQLNRGKATLEGAKVELRLAENEVRDNRGQVSLLQRKIAAVEEMPGPDPADLAILTAALRGAK